jgi:hypothetical protein
MSLRRLGVSNYHLISRRQIKAHHDGPSARLILQQFKDDPGAMRDFRAVLDEAGLGIPNTRTMDTQVIESVARLIASGEVVLVREWPAQGGNAVQKIEPPSPDLGPSAAAGASSKAQEPENATLPNTDGALQAAALQAAAADGAPFCGH